MVQWFSALNSGDGSLLRSRSIPRMGVVVCDDAGGYRKYAIYNNPFESYRDFAGKSDGERCGFEVIFGNKFQKIYFDVDISLKEDGNSIHTRDQKCSIAHQIPGMVIDALIKVHPSIRQSDIMVFNSNSDEKYSYHIVVDRWYVTTARQNRKVYEQVISYIPIQWRQYFDGSMYKSIQQFRLYMSTKYGKKRMKVLDPTYSTWLPDSDVPLENLNREVYFSSLVQRVENCVVLPFEDEEEKEFQEVELTDSDTNRLLIIIKNMPYSSCFSVQDKKGSMVLLKRRQPSYCKCCDRTHENDNPFVTVSVNGDVHFNCRRNEDGLTTKLGNINDEIIFHHRAKKLRTFEVPCQVVTSASEVSLHTFKRVDSFSPDTIAEALSPLSVVSSSSNESRYSIESSSSNSSNVSRKFSEIGNKRVRKMKERQGVSRTLNSVIS